MYLIIQTSGGELREGKQINNGKGFKEFMLFLPKKSLQNLLSQSNYKNDSESNTLKVIKIFCTYFITYANLQSFIII